MNRIEEELGISDTQTQATASSQQPYTPEKPEPADQPEPVEPSSQPSTTATNASDQFVEWIRENWLMKVGGLLILIAFGWFVSYAFAEGWIGPMGRIGLGLIVGAVVMIAGKLRMPKSENQGTVMTVLGSTIILLTMLAGQHIYGFFTPLTTLAIMLAVTIMVGVFSVMEKSKALAISSLALGALTPVLIAVDIGVVGLLSYIAIVVAGTIWVVALTKWRILTLAALLITIFYCFHFLGSPVPTEQIALMFVWGFSSLFFIINIFSYLWDKAKPHASDVLVTFGTASLLLVWILSAISSGFQSLVLLVGGVILGLGAYILYRSMDTLVPAASYATVAVAFLASATWIEFSGAALTIAYALEIFALIILMGMFVKKIDVLQTLSFLYIVPIILSFQQISSASWNTGVFHTDFLTLVILIAVFLLSGMYFHQHVETHKDSEDKLPYALPKAYVSAVAAYSSLLLWLSLHAMSTISSDVATGIALSVYTVVGLYLYFVGKRDGRDFMVYLGLVFAWGVVARLMFVEFWMMDTTGKIVTFLIVGGLFFATALLAPDDDSHDSP